LGKGEQTEHSGPFDLYAICINNGLPLLGSYKVVVVVVVVVVATRILSILLHSGCRFFPPLWKRKGIGKIYQIDYTFGQNQAGNGRLEISDVWNVFVLITQYL